MIICFHRGISAAHIYTLICVYVYICTHVNLTLCAQVSGGWEATNASERARVIGAGKGNQWQKSPLICQDIFREMSEAMQIIRNNRDPCCYSPFFSLTMQIPPPGIESKAKVL